ncbi:hypothetical protein HDA44_000659 [Kribbella solani]|uniref:Uncharacterized protein n=1 Tax=Kribbella solani TaxID=236067 RepID=A0A841DPD1_9ACTN|nr:hypothetical protein [Kribbella solani]
MSTAPENTAVRAPEPTGSRRTKAAFVTGLTPLVRRRAITRCPFLAPRVPHYGVRLSEPGSAAPQAKGRLTTPFAPSPPACQG